MPSTRDIRRRIVSVKKTAQITSAMEKVAQAKMARAQQAARAGRPYAELSEIQLDGAGNLFHGLDLRGGTDAAHGESHRDRRAHALVKQVGL